jgi:hypothetical protein
VAANSTIYKKDFGDHIFPRTRNAVSLKEGRSSQICVPYQHILKRSYGEACAGNNETKYYRYRAIMEHREACLRKLCHPILASYNRKRCVRLYDFEGQIRWRSWTFLASRKSALGMHETVSVCVFIFREWWTGGKRKMVHADRQPRYCKLRGWEDWRSRVG